LLTGDCGPAKLSNFTHDSRVRSPVTESEAESAAEAYWAVPLNWIASVEAANGKSVNHSVVPLFVRLLAVLFVCWSL
jgi:hypothetical protein